MSLFMSGWSQADCLWERDISGTGVADHCSRPKQESNGRGHITTRQNGDLQLMSKKLVMPVRRLMPSKAFFLVGQSGLV